ncbi:MAG TPA: hypothetical protein PLU30_01230 [Verrucomicrobiae bacterium]|nr:hypothetical protein [Verrucomicrobiae bacterium]
MTEEKTEVGFPFPRRAFLRGAAFAAVAGPGWLGSRAVAASGTAVEAASAQVPEWIAPGKLRWVWALWEPFALYRRGGYGAGIGDGHATGHWVRRWYDRMHGGEILDKLAAAGVNLVTTHFYKGFGLKAEAEEMARAADFTRRAHARGIRVLGYHQFSTVVYETMLDEVPNLEEWIQRGPDGSLKTYGSASWRWSACPTHDDFIAYLKRVVDRCLLEADMDGVEFDGTSYECWCPRCTELFCEYLAKNNSDPLDRFGLPHFRHVRIPPVRDARDPLWQEWSRFRIDVMGRRLREMREYVHRKKPGAAMVTYEDCARLWRKDRTRLLPDAGDYLDMAVAESHEMPQVLNGQLVTKIRHLKEGTAIGQIALSTDWITTVSGKIELPNNAKPVELDMAECLACGGHVCTATWALRSGDRRDGSAFFEQPEFHAALKRYMGFSRDHEALYVGSRPCANIWVYHDPWSLAFDHDTAYNSVLGMEQALLGRIAYRVAKPAHLSDLGSRDVLIVASQTCLSDEICAAIGAAAARGCGVLVTGPTAAYDQDFRERDADPLAAVKTHPRVRYLQKCPGRTPQPDYSAGKWMRATMPAASAGILKIVRGLAGEGLAAELEGGDALQPLTFVDVYRQGQGSTAHVIWYGDGEPKDLRLRVAPWAATGTATLHSPHLAGPMALSRGDDGWIALPTTFGRYAAVHFAG